MYVDIFDRRLELETEPFDRRIPRQTNICDRLIEESWTFMTARFCSIE